MNKGNLFNWSFIWYEWCLNTHVTKKKTASLLLLTLFLKNPYYVMQYYILIPSCFSHGSLCMSLAWFPTTSFNKFVIIMPTILFKCQVLLSHRHIAAKMRYCREHCRYNNVCSLLYSQGLHHFRVSVVGCSRGLLGGIN